MKIKITDRELLNRYSAIKFGYCDIQFLTNNLSPKFYNYGKCGWRWDAYIIDNIALCTGYDSPSAAQHPTPEQYKKIRHFEYLATKHINHAKAKKANFTRFVEYIKSIL